MSQSQISHKCPLSSCCCRKNICLLITLCSLSRSAWNSPLKFVPLPGSHAQSLFGVEHSQLFVLFKSDGHSVEYYVSGYANINTGLVSQVTRWPNSQNKQNLNKKVKNREKRVWGLICVYYQTPSNFELLIIWLDGFRIVQQFVFVFYTLNTRVLLIFSKP